MSIYIRGMDKPKTCEACDFCEIKDIWFEMIPYCTRLKRFLSDEETLVVPQECPILQVQPHGDLIDREKYEYPGDLKYETVVIPADEEDSDVCKN